MLQRLLALLFPPKCILCRRLLTKDQTDLCRDCREKTELFSKGKFKIPFVAGWTSVWYYKDNVRSSLMRFKFYGHRSYAAAYGRLLAMKLQEKGWDQPDLLTWVPISARRLRKRGYDQSQLLAQAVASELGTVAVPTLKKIRHTNPQSTKKDSAQRRANVLGAYRAIDPDRIRDKTIVLIDDIITTGSTASECAKTLCIAGAAQIHCVSVAAAGDQKK